MPNTTYQKTVVRLWQNPRFGKGMGPKQINRFLFNGSVQFPNTNLRLHVDLAQLEHYPVAINAKDAGLFEQLIVGVCDRLGWDQSHVPNIAMGQMFELIDRQKQFLESAVFFHMQTNQCVVLVFDEQRGLQVKEEFPLSHCMKAKEGKKSPDYFGSNYEVEPKPAATNVDVHAVLNRLNANLPSIGTS